MSKSFVKILMKNKRIIEIYKKKENENIRAQSLTKIRNIDKNEKYLSSIVSFRDGPIIKQRNNSSTISLPLLKFKKLNNSSPNQKDSSTKNTARSSYKFNLSYPKKSKIIEPLQSTQTIRD